MKHETVPLSPLFLARLAGFLYFLVIPLGIFGLLAQSRLIVSGDAAATATNIMASERSFRLGIMSDLLAPIVLMVVVLLLYRLLKHIHENAALLMLIFLLIGASIALLNKVNQFAALQLLSGADYLTVFTTDQVQALAYLFLRIHGYGSEIAFIFWGLWLLPLGYLVFKSGFIPKILGILLVISCFGYLANSLVSLLGLTLNIGLFSALGEILFILWLMIKGVNLEQWHKRMIKPA